MSGADIFEAKLSRLARAWRSGKARHCWVSKGVRGGLLEVLGLAFRASCAGDKRFYLALAAAPVALVIMTWLLPAWSRGIHLSLPLMISLVLWQPLVEELLFRGVIQGQLRNMHWAQRRIAGLTLANLITTVLFALAHLIHHTALWAALVIVPSLIFGYFRDRHHHVYCAFILHAVYNGCYLLIGAHYNGTGIGG